MNFRFFHDLCCILVIIGCFELPPDSVSLQIRKTRDVSVFKVGFAGGVYYEGPVCNQNGGVESWHSPSAEWRYVEPEWDYICSRVS